jgi:hypothetical protein
MLWICTSLLNLAVPLRIADGINTWQIDSTTGMDYMLVKQKSICSTLLSESQMDCMLGNGFYISNIDLSDLTETQI